ncbi:hypothetical protein OERS_22540 [Oerskovia enterophila]|uniref:Uncharacterized protein n=1 Tax=Oerskovia enterophila TaxID=43678 RepID=A0ABX2Y5M9_9CELL|nr:hypothetical protein OERS_22540 [Oerskovia enterophila]
MAVTLTATLVSAGTPQPVQLVLTGIPAGTRFVIEGTADAGASVWPVPGGIGVADSGQTVRVDNRSALNRSVTYRATVAGVTHTAAPVTIAHPGRVVLQSLDGQIVAPVRLHDNDDPRELDLRSHATTVPGRSRPPARVAPAGYGSGALEVTTTGAATAALRDLLLSGLPIVVRTDGTAPLERAVDLALPQRAPYSLATVREYGDSRRWVISFLFVDDPEPSAVLAAWTNADFNAAMAARTNAGFNALFAGSTNLQFNTYDWGQLLP